jgi:adenylate kinase
MALSYRVVIVGRPGAGKGTQTRLLATHLRVNAIDLGELLRAERGRDTVHGYRLRRLAPGAYAPHPISYHLLQGAVLAAEPTGWVLDGYPRLVDQIANLDKLIAPGVVDAVVLLEVPPGVASERLGQRVACEGCGRVDPPYDTMRQICDLCGGKVGPRLDDAIDRVRERSAVYEQRTSAVIADYRARGILRRIDGNGSRAEVLRRICRVLNEADPNAVPGLSGVAPTDGGS